MVDPAISAWLPAPAPREKLIGLIAKISQMNEGLLLEKYRRHAREIAAPGAGSVAGPLRASTMAGEDRPRGTKNF